MRRFSGLAAAIAVGYGLSGPATANDTLAILKAGGLEFTRTDDVAMVREDLDISVERIAVRYVFRNRSAVDVRSTVAFPLPLLPGGLLDNSPVDLKPSEDANFVGFTVKVDGKPFTPAIEVKALDRDGKDVTREVRRFGLSPNFMAKDALDGPGADVDGARKAGLVYEGGEEAWDMQATFHWEQTFPAGRDVVVEHAYRPVAGSSGFFFGEGSDRATFCVDKGTEAAIARLWKDDPQSVYYASRVVEYVLLSARSWAGPIGEFHLTLRKDKPTSVVSACLDGLRRTSPTTYEMTAKDFVPRRDLGILFVHEPGYLHRQVQPGRNGDEPAQ